MTVAANLLDLLPKKIYSVMSLGEYPFEIQDLESVQKKITPGWHKVERLGNFPGHFAKGQWEERYEFEATFTMRTNDYLKQFETMVTEKKPVWLTFPSGEAVEVVIVESEMTKSLFDGDGNPIRQVIKLVLEAYHE